VLLPIIGLTVTAGHLGMTIWARKKHIPMKWYDWVIVSVVLIALPIALTSTISFMADFYPFYGTTSLLIFHIMSVTLPLIIGIWYFFERFVRSSEEDRDAMPLEPFP
jgi:hypothetical protein